MRQHATTEMQVTAAQMQKQYEEIRRELDVLNKQRGDDQRRIEKLGQDNAALAEQVKALGANPSRRPVSLYRRCLPHRPARKANHSQETHPYLSAAGQRCCSTADGVLSREWCHATTTGDVPVCAGA